MSKILEEALKSLSQVTEETPIINFSSHRSKRLKGSPEIQRPLFEQKELGAEIINLLEYLRTPAEQIIEENVDILIDSSFRSRALMSEERLAVVFDQNGFIVTEYLLINENIRSNPINLLPILLSMGYLSEGNYGIVERESPVSTPAWTIVTENSVEILTICERLMRGTANHPENTPPQSA